jgi:hypothetical protein
MIRAWRRWLPDRGGDHIAAAATGVFGHRPDCRRGNAELGKLERRRPFREPHEIRRTASGELSARGADRVPLRKGTGAAPPRCQAPAQFDGVLRTERVHARSREAAASQDRDRGVVAEARPQGTASSPRSPVARR